MEHIERAGVHSGDSIAVYPRLEPGRQNAPKDLIAYTAKLALAPEHPGPGQYPVCRVRKRAIYVIEVNPRASRTVPYISKVTGVPMVDLATRAMLGETLPRFGLSAQACTAHRRM